MAIPTYLTAVWHCLSCNATWEQKYIQSDGNRPSRKLKHDLRVCQFCASGNIKQDIQRVPAKQRKAKS